MRRDASAERTCPSSTCSVGHFLIGLPGPDGRIGYLSPPLEVDTEFIESASARTNDRPEARFRFASPCVKEKCQQWTGASCGVISLVLQKTRPKKVSEKDLPECAIRSSCRWFWQEGGSACGVCPEILHTRA
jgi:hypothetical protein